MTTHRKILAVEEMAVAAAEAIKQEKSLAKASKKAGKPSALGSGSMSMNMSVKESKEKVELKGIKVNDNNEVHQMKDGKGPAVPVPDPSLALTAANTSAVTSASHGDETVSASTSAYTGMTSMGDISDDNMNVECQTGHLVHAVSGFDSTGTQSDGVLSHDGDTMTASLLIPGLGLGPGPSDRAFSEGTVRGSGQEGTVIPGYGDGLTVQDTAMTASANAKNVPKNAIENVPEKRSSRVRVPKRIFEADSNVQSSEEITSTLDCEDDATVPKGVVDGVKSEDSPPVEPEEPEEEEEPTGMTVILPDELTPNPDPTSYLPCLVYSLPCEDAFYACCMDQVGAVMSRYVMSCHVMSCRALFLTMPYYVLCNNLV